MTDFRVLAPRGLPRHHLAHSVAGLGASIPHADAVEFDVRRAACGTMVCVHDDSLERITGHQMHVADQTWRSLREVHPQIATLPDVVGAISHHTGMFVDLKLGGLGVERDLIDALRRTGVSLETAAHLRFGELPGPGEAIIEAGSVRSLLRIARLAPRVGRLYVMPGQTKPVWLRTTAPRLKGAAHGVALPLRLAHRQAIRWLRRLGLRVFVYTVNDPVDARRIQLDGADGIFTDVADTMRQELAVADRRETG